MKSGLELERDHALWATKVLRPERSGAMRRDDARNLLRRTFQAYVIKHPLVIHAWAVEPARVHVLAAMPGDIDVEEILADLFGYYTRRFNARYRRRGALFRTKFLTRVTPGALAIIDAIRRLHLLPAENDKRLPGGEAWSSRAVYEGGAPDGVVTLYEPGGGAIRREQALDA